MLAPAALVAFAFAGSTMVTPLYPLYQRAFGFSQLTLTLIYAAYVIGNLLALVLFGRLPDQLGRHRMAYAAIAIACGSAVLFLLATGTPWLFPARIASGLAVGIGAGTGTAWIADLDDGGDKSRATVIATCANFAGLGLGPLCGGLLAQYAPWPLRLVYGLYFLALLLVGLSLRLAPETVAAPKPRPDAAALRPRLGVPAAVVGRFIAPAATAFGTFSLFGFYFSLIPSLLAKDLHRPDPGLAGAVVLELSAAAAACIVATRRLESRRAMLVGSVLLLPSVALLVCAREFASMGILLGGTALSGIAGALGYRGSLQVVNRIAPGGQRAELVSSYMIACFLGNSVPVIGIGVLSGQIGAAAAIRIFAATVAAFAAGGLVAGLRYRRD
ncbi:MAG TPA: MFS transporter [Nevskia sp.]|nr:MFS transporter [Nevskia sp.]